MAVLQLDYGEISDAGKAARKAADKCRNYGENLEQRVCKKLDSLSCGGGWHTDYAKRFARKKIDELEEKAGSFEQYARKLDQFVNHDTTGAKQVDRRVGRMIKLKYNEFKDKYNIFVNPVIEAMTYWFTGITNQNGFLELLKKGFSFHIELIHQIKEAIKYSYRCLGGREFLKVTWNCLLAVAAIVGVVLAWPVMIGALSALWVSFTASALWTAVVATAFFVTQTISAADHIVKVIQNSKALLNIAGNEPGKGKWNSSIKSTSDWLRKNIFDSREWNRFSMDAANNLDIVEFAGNTILFFDFVHNGYKWVDNLKKGGWDNFKKNIYKKGFSTFRQRNPEYDKYLKNPNQYTKIPSKTQTTFSTIKDGFTNIKKLFQRGTENKSMNYMKTAVEGKGKAIHLELNAIHFDYTRWGTGFENISKFNKDFKIVKESVSFVDKLLDKGRDEAIADKVLSSIPFVSNFKKYKDKFVILKHIH